MRFSSILPVVLVLAGCAEPGTPAAEGGEPVDPPENRPPMLSSSTSVVLGEGETRSLGPVFDPDGDPVVAEIRDVTPGLTVEVVDDELEVSLGYGIAVEDGAAGEGGVARATVALDDGRGGRLVEELFVHVASLTWRERAVWTAENGPPPRRGAVHLLVDGALYVLFGEEAGAPATDAWRFDPTDATWSPVALVGDVPTPGAGKRAVRLPTWEVLLHGGVGPDGEPLDELHRVGVESATVLAFERIEQEGAPPPRADHVFVPGPAAIGEEPAGPAAVVFGGLGGTSDAPEALADLWTMELVDGRARWSSATPDVLPPARIAMATASDVEAGRVVLFGGRAEPSGPPLDGTWELDLRATGGPRFAAIEVEQPPTARVGAAAAWDPDGHRAFLVGGTDATGVVLDEVLVLDTRGDAAAWVAIERSGAPSLGEGALALAWTPAALYEDASPRAALWVGLGSASTLHALAPRVGDGYGGRW